MNKFPLLLNLFIFFLYTFIGCFNNDPKIEGYYLATNNPNLDDIKISLNLYSENTKQEHEYFVKLRKDGFYSVKIKQRGHCLLIFSLRGHTFPIWKEPLISNEMLPYHYNIKEGKDIIIEDQYISDPIEIISPNTGQGYRRLDELEIRWQKIPFADHYDVSISEFISSDKDQLIISTHNLRNNQISFTQIRSLEFVDRVFEAKELLEMNPFNRLFEELEKGKYVVRIRAYKVWEEKNILLMLTNPDMREEVIFDVL